MPRLGNDLDPRVRNASPEDLGIRGDHEPIARTPYDEGGRGDAGQALLEAALRNREEELRGRPETADQSDQELHLVRGAVVPVTDEAGHGEHGLGRGAGLVVEQVRYQLVRHVAEEVDDGCLVTPEPDGRGEGEPVDLERPEGGP